MNARMPTFQLFNVPGSPDTQGVRGILCAAVVALSSCQFDVGGDLGAIDDAAVIPHADASLPRADAAPADATLGPDATLIPDAHVPAPCPDDYAPLGADGTVYRLGFGILNWDLAEADCEDDGDGTHLVVIEDEDELDQVTDMIGVGTAWVGVTDRIEEDQWLTVFGEEAEVQPWGGGEPNDANGGEDCVELHAPPRKFNDVGCGKPNRYVCECDGREPDPAAF
jgi:lectin-like protein